LVVVVAAPEDVPEDEPEDVMDAGVADPRVAVEPADVETAEAVDAETPLEGPVATV
jgi:hypothetical protein